jgi:hypothetical protein
MADDLLQRLQRKRSHSSATVALLAVLLQDPGDMTMPGDSSGRLGRLCSVKVQGTARSGSGSHSRAFVSESRSDGFGKK